MELGADSHGEEVPRGIRNLGNTCFVNAALQALASVPDFVKYLEHHYKPELTLSNEASVNLIQIVDDIRREGPSDINYDELLRDAFGYSGDLVQMLAETCGKILGEADGQPVSPIELVCSFDSIQGSYRLGVMDDSIMFLRSVFATLDEFNSGTVSMFTGRMTTQMTCTECGRTGEEKYEYFREFSLPIVRDGGRAFRSVQEVIDYMIADDEVERRCTCPNGRRAIKSSHIDEPPDVLFLSLLRSKRGRKNNRHVAFGATLELPVSGLDHAGTVYDLTGVIEHQGRSFHGGHYVSFVRHGGRWAKTSDDIVEEVDFKRVLKAQAYGLFYTRRQPEVVPEPAPPEIGPCGTLWSWVTNAFNNATRFVEGLLPQGEGCGGCGGIFGAR